MINTLSKWNYGHTITSNNNAINFNEGSGELLGTILSKDYTLGEFADAVASAMNGVGTQEYTVSLNRLNNKLTISAASNFSLLPQTGTQTSLSAFSLMGFTTDVSGSNSYTGENQSGFQYAPQYYLQNFINFEDDERSNQAKVNTAATGDVVEVVDYGTQFRMSCLIDFVKDDILGVHINKTNTGLQELRQFLQYIRTKSKLEFVPDVANPSDNITKCIADSIGSSRDGTGFVIREDFSLNYFRSGNLVFLKVR